MKTGCPTVASAEGYVSEQRHNHGLEKNSTGDLPSIPLLLTGSERQRSQEMGKMGSGFVLPLPLLPSSFPRCIDVAR